MLILNLISPSQIEFVFRDLYSFVQGSGRKFKKIDYNSEDLKP